jgi:hypothetical protein
VKENCQQLLVKSPLKADAQFVEYLYITFNILSWLNDIVCELHDITLVPEVYFYYFHCEGRRKNKPLVESGN